MQAFIRWPAGTRGESDEVRRFTPATYDRYIEPFFGSGTVFRTLEPERAVINDIDDRLIDFYRYLKGDRDRETFRTWLDAYVDHWETLNVVSAVTGDIRSHYAAFRDGDLPRCRFEDELSRIFDGATVFEQFSESVCLDRAQLCGAVTDRIVTDLSRLADLHDSNEAAPAQIDAAIKTAIRGGSFVHFRSLLNDVTRGRRSLSRPHEIATYYYVRELCYGAMFRYDSTGEFVVPYGGIAYNGTPLRDTVDALFTPTVETLFQGTTIYSTDFETALRRCEPTADDFLYLDPPYDPGVDRYAGTVFSNDDHRRLASVVEETRATFLLVIKDTPFIRSLYEGLPNVTVRSYAEGASDEQNGGSHLVVHDLDSDRERLRETDTDGSSV